MRSPNHFPIKLFGIIDMRTTSNLEIKQVNWQTVILITLGCWLSSILLLDLIIMPSLYLSGMMVADGFASAGYSVFWVFNRLELVAAGLVLSGCFVLSNQFRSFRWSIIAAVLLLSLSLFATYSLAPQMSAIAINLHTLDNVSLIPDSMDVLHGLYWSVEAVKLAILALLFKSFWQNQNQ